MPGYSAAARTWGTAECVLFPRGLVFCDIHVDIQQQLRVRWTGNHPLHPHLGETEAREREMSCSQPRRLEVSLLVRESPASAPAASLKKDHSFTFIL